MHLCHLIFLILLNLEIAFGVNVPKDKPAETENTDEDVDELENYLPSLIAEWQMNWSDNEGATQNTNNTWDFQTSQEYDCVLHNSPIEQTNLDVTHQPEEDSSMTSSDSLQPANALHLPVSVLAFTEIPAQGNETENMEIPNTVFDLDKSPPVFPS